MPRLQLPRPPERKPLPRPAARPLRSSKGSLPRPPSSAHSRTPLPTPPQRSVPPQLPKPTEAEWQTLQTEDGTPYYLHVSTQKTVWERPAELAPEETANTVVETVVTPDPAPMEPTALGPPGGVATTEAPVVTVEATTPTAATDDPLLPGWTACWDENAESYYYVNDTDQSTTWERPAATVATAPSAAAAEPSPLVEETTPPETALVTPEIAPLPEGWTELWTDEGVPYYVCDADGSSTWERPTVEEPAPVVDAVAKMPPEEKEVVAVVEPEQEPAAPGSGPSAAPSVTLSDALPPGWVELYNDEGTPYYLYEPDQSVTWDRPVAPVEETQATAADDCDYPPEAVAPHVMDQDQSTSKDEPEVVTSSNAFQDTFLDQAEADGSAPPMETVESVQKDQAADLPPGWQEMQDFDGNVYYYNTIDDSTTWEKPAVGPAGSEREEVSNIAAADLPPEWQELQDDEGNVYYYNTVDGATSWEKPSVEAEKYEEHISPEMETVEDLPVAPQTPEEANPTDVPTALETELDAGLEQEEAVPEEQRVTEEVFAEAPVSDLLPGWQEVQDEGGNTYYYNTEDGTTTWDRPAAPINGTTAPPIPETSHNESILPHIAAQENVAAMVPEAEVGAGIVAKTLPLDRPAPESTEEEVATNPEPTTGFLLPGWKELQDEQGMVYYHNLVDGTTTWAKPIAEEETASVTEAEAHADGLPPAHGEANLFAVDAGRETTLPTDTAVTEQEPESNESATTPTDLPPNWEEVQMDDGTVYYFNTMDQTSSWERPVLQSSAVGDTPESLSKEEPATALELSSQQVVELTSESNVVPLPEGWTEAVTDDGVTFYINDKTQESVWERPAVSSLDMSSPPNSGDQHTVDNTQQVSPKSEDFSYEEVDPMLSTEPLRDGWVDDMDANEPAAQDELPPGWKELHDMDTDSTYYLNELDGSTQWERPLRSDAKNRATTGSETKVVPEETGKEAIDEGWTTPYAVPSLTEGWTEYIDPSSGNPYFYNEATGETRHERPHPNGTLDAKPTNLGYEHELPPRNATFPAIVSFGFGGKICIVRPEVKPVVKIYRTHQLVPNEPICQLVASKTANGISGPLAKIPDDVVSHYIDGMAGYEDSQLLWSLVSIAVKCRGRLRSLGDTSGSVRPQPMIAKLLVKDYATHTTQDAEPDLNESSRESLIRLEQLLIDGKREEAVEHAVESGNFPMAILIASMLGRDALMTAVNGYIEKAHFTGKPLHALALLFSGLLKPSSNETGSYWDEINPETLKATWKYHLAGMLNNTVEKWEHLVVALGTRLAKIDPDNVIAAHVCYLVCGCAVGRPITGAPILLLGSNSTLTDLARCSPSAIDSFQLTEAYEWAKRRGNYNASIRSLQVFKIVLAHQLCDFGFVEASKLYLESVIEHLGWTIHDAQSLPQAEMLLSCGSEDVANEELVSLAANLLCRLTGSVPTVHTSKPAPEEATDVNASFMTAHTTFHDDDAAIPSDDFVAGPDRTGGPVSGHDKKEPSQASAPPFVGIPQRFPSGPDSQPATYPPGEPSFVGQPKPPAVDTTPQTTDSAPLITPGIAQAKPEAAPSSAPANLQPSKSAKNSSAKQRSFFNFGIKEYVIKKLNPEATTADLGGNMEAYYDEDKKVWVFPGEDPAEKVKPIPPPPKALGVPSSAPAPTPASNDPLAAMMAPPSRAPSARKTPSNTGKPPAFPPGMAPRSAPSKPVNFSAFAPPPNAPTGGEG